jgi:uncharacterized protein (TIGR02145 family)
MKKVVYTLIFIFILTGCSKKDSSNSGDPVNPPNSITDIDGNIYHADTIGSQVWMVENLKTTRYSDGTAIPLVTDNQAWGSMKTPAYCWYNNDAGNYKKTYGALYNNYAANAGICPKGWHVATDSDWYILVEHCGGGCVAGCKMKEKGSLHWNSPNEGATNESGFTALPGGQRDFYGNFQDIGNWGGWWTASSNDFGVGYSIFNDLKGAYGGEIIQTDGLSVRCVRDK